jgi:hypothetical protein
MSPPRRSKAVPRRYRCWCIEYVFDGTLVAAATTARPGSGIAKAAISQLRLSSASIATSSDVVNKVFRKRVVLP